MLPRVVDIPDRPVELLIPAAIDGDETLAAVDQRFRQIPLGAPNLNVVVPLLKHRLGDHINELVVGLKAVSDLQGDNAAKFEILTVDRSGVKPLQTCEHPRQTNRPGGQAGSVTDRRPL